MKYVCEVVIEADKKVLKKEMREFIEAALAASDKAPAYVGKVRVRSVDTD